MKQVKRDSQKQVKMGTRTLYSSIKRMLADGLIEEAAERVRHRKGALPMNQRERH
jgi:hypothetical protein